VFLASAAAVVVAACSDSSEPDVATFTPGTGSTDPATTPPATSTPPTTAEAPAADLPGYPFTLGVASGDPDATSVVLWTRLAPDPLAGGGMPDADIDVLWEASGAPEFTEIAASGIVTAGAEHGHTLHLLAALEPGEWYFRFRVGEHTSPVGRTHVAPGADEPVEGVRFAAASCQNYAAGHYAAPHIEQQPDFRCGSATTSTSRPALPMPKRTTVCTSGPSPQMSRPTATATPATRPTHTCRPPTRPARGS
jgi:hypothetical protein